MFDSIEFYKFKILRKATLPLAPFTLIVGPNGSGKSTALQALLAVKERALRELEGKQTDPTNFDRFVTAGLEATFNIHARVEIRLQWSELLGSKELSAGATTVAPWPRSGFSTLHHYRRGDGEEISHTAPGRILNFALSGIRVYSLDASTIIQSTKLEPDVDLSPNGGNLVGVMDSLRDKEPERFEALNKELGRWLPEFDRILFETPETGQRAFLLRTRKGHHKIPARDLSQGTVLALAILTMAYLPDPPPLIGIEEPERGVHPRLLRNIQAALYRLSYPEQFDEERQPVQVIATTHSPYFLDLYKDHPEEIVIAQKTADGATFERLSDQPDIMEVLDDAPLGEVWYSGILGGVPAEQ